MVHTQSPRCFGGFLATIGESVNKCASDTIYWR